MKTIIVVIIVIIVYALIKEHADQSKAKKHMILYTVLISLNLCGMIICTHFRYEKIALCFLVLLGITVYSLIIWIYRNCFFTNKRKREDVGNK
jgi:tryptophan-rich sensory protein